MIFFIFKTLLHGQMDLFIPYPNLYSVAEIEWKKRLNPSKCRQDWTLFHTVLHFVFHKQDITICHRTHKHVGIYSPSNIYISKLSFHAPAKHNKTQ